MTKVPVTIRTRHFPDVPPLETEGELPYADCPLAVTRRYKWDNRTNSWDDIGRWCITHRPTGLCLTADLYNWPSSKQAMAALNRCDPTFPAWPLCTGDKTDIATIACRFKFRVAMGE